MRHFELATICPHCGETGEQCTGIGGLGPQPGNASVCVYCGKVGIFNGQLVLRKPTDVEQLQIQMEPSAPMIDLYQDIAKTAPWNRRRKA